MRATRHLGRLTLISLLVTLTTFEHLQEIGEMKCHFSHMRRIYPQCIYNKLVKSLTYIDPRAGISH